MTETADIIVIGAGIFGSPIAYQLARAGRRVLVIDREHGAGYGTTSNSCGIIRFEYTAPESVFSAYESSFAWADLRDYLEAPAGETLPTFYRVGMVVVDSPILPRDQLKARFDALAIPYEDWDAAELRRRVPGIDAGRFYPPQPTDSEAFWDDPVGEVGALFEPTAGFIDDPRLAAEAFYNAAARHGARALFQTKVTGVTHTPAGTWTLALDNGDRAEAPVVVNATGPWAPEVEALAGVAADIRIKRRIMRSEIHVLPVPPGYNPPDGLGPNLTDDDLGMFIRPEPGGTLQLGGSEPECDPIEWIDYPVDEINLNRTKEWWDRNTVRLARRFPELQIPTRPAGVVGVHDVSEDWTPIYDKTDHAGFYIAAGASGNQFKCGPLVGEYLRAIIEWTESGHDHDADPVTYTGRHTGQTISLGFYSRRRTPAPNSGTSSG
jgi:glycine/D-amino acid oxidase-like deaminating enzyme